MKFKFYDHNYKEVSKNDPKIKELDKSLLNLVLGFELNAEFEKFVLHLRKKYSIPKDGFNYPENASILLQIEENKKLYSECEKRVVKNKLHRIENKFYSITDIIYEIVYYNSVRFEIGDDPFLICNDFAQGISDGDNSLEIIIDKQVTKNRIISYIDRNWDEIEELMSTLPSESEFELSADMIEIYELYMSGNYTFNQIADKLNNRTGKYIYRYNEDQVKNIFHRAKKKIESLFR